MGNVSLVVTPSTPSAKVRIDVVEDLKGRQDVVEEAILDVTFFLGGRGLVEVLPLNVVVFRNESAFLPRDSGLGGQVAGSSSTRKGGWSVPSWSKSLEQR